MDSRKLITIVMLCITVLFIYYSMNAAPLISDEKYTYIAGLKWYKSYDEGLAVALEQNKPMLVYFWAIWCQYCEKLHTSVYPDKEVSRLLSEKFVLVAVDLNENKKDVQRFSVQYPPHLIFLTPQSEIIMRIPGYIPKDDFLGVLNQIANPVSNETSP